MPVIRLALAVVCTIAALFIAAPAHAADSDYTLRVVDRATGEVRTATLSCDPVVGGSHPDAAAACEQLAESGSIESARGEAGPCTQIHQPVTAIAEGAEEYIREFPNKCVLTSEKGAVFDF